MMETFDELFDDFFGGKNKKPKKTRRKTKKNDIDSEISKIIDSLSNFKQVEENDFDEDYDVDLGEPIKVQYFQTDGLYFKRSIWHVEKNGEKGELIKLEVSDTPFEDEKNDKSLEECLQDALDEENYEKAAEIRDKINKLKN